VSVNSAAVRNPEIITGGANRYGSQCIVLGMDAEADSSMASGYGIVIDGGRVKTGRDMLEWAKEAESRGAGEIVLNSIDADGTRDGYEITATRLVSEAVGIPVVASGGAGIPRHLRDVLTEGKADAALVASMVHYGDYSIETIKKELSESGVPVRLD
jgi:cyclase